MTHSILVYFRFSLSRWSIRGHPRRVSSKDQTGCFTTLKVLNYFIAKLIEITQLSFSPPTLCAALTKLKQSTEGKLASYFGITYMTCLTNIAECSFSINVSHYWAAAELFIDLFTEAENFSSFKGCNIFCSKLVHFDWGWSSRSENTIINLNKYRQSSSKNKTGGRARPLV